jgi:hypothetical protein
VFVAIPTAIETLSGGRSIGKLATGTRVVSDDNGPIAPRQALVRAMVGFIEIWVMGGVGAMLTMIINPRTKRLGDLAAGTLVIRERIRLTTPSPTMMPPHLATWARGADISSLPAGLAMTIRQFLLRRGALGMGARADLAARLLADVRPFLAPQPPEWVHQEDVLQAVIAERAARDMARLSSEAALRNRLLGVR